MNEEACGVGERYEADDGHGSAGVGGFKAEGGCEVVRVEWVQPGFVHVQDMIAVELIQILNARVPDMR